MLTRSSNNPKSKACGDPFASAQDKLRESIQNPKLSNHSLIKQRHFDNTNYKNALLFCLVLASCLSGCASYPRLLDFPFDAGGRSLNSPASELTPQVTPPFIAFISNRNGSQDVYLFDAKARRLIDLPGLNSLDEIASHPSVSEDGRYLVFAASRQGRTGIYLYDRETQQKRNLTQNLAAEVRNPTISADGSTIAFEVAKEGQWDIAVYNRRGEPLPIPGNI